MHPIALGWLISAVGGADPAPERLSMVASAQMRAMCWAHDVSPEQWAAILEANHALPPGQVEIEGERFASHPSVWFNDPDMIDATGRAQRVSLTYSFPNDGTTWGSAISPPTGPNVLNASLIAHFGAGNLDRGREYLRQSLAGWRKYGGLTYDEVADNHAAMHNSAVRSASHGDIRFGGFNMDGGGLLAFNFYPSFGGDVVFNTFYFLPSAFNSPSNSYRYLRNTMAHEHGHGVGCFHTVPCAGERLMEPFIITGRDSLQVDERRIAGSNYGDRYSGNQSAATAKNFGTLTSPAPRSVVERDLSTNGVSGPFNTDEDWFKFTTTSVQNVVITATPTGGTYVAGDQVSGCSGTAPTINATSAGNLNIQLVASDGVTVLQTAQSQGVGLAETMNIGALGAGTFHVRVFDVGPNAFGNQIVQLYDLSIRVGTAPAGPLAIAGINKRIAANVTCAFVGDVNSEATDGTLDPVTAYDWDLDGDGTFEINDQPKPSRTYPSNGLYPVKLRVTDSNSLTSIDTINVTVFGATTSVSGCNPMIGQPGTTVPVTITGVNLKNVLSASMVTVSGSGVTVTGTPTPNVLGTTVTGLSFVISSGAALTARNVTVSNSDGSGTAIAAFTVNAAPPVLPGAFTLTAPLDGVMLADTSPSLSWGTSSNAQSYNVKIDDDPLFLSPEYNINTGFRSVLVPPGSLAYKKTYHWRVTATNLSGSTAGTPSSRSFRTGSCDGDANADLNVAFSDITSVLENWGFAYGTGNSGAGDANDDGVVSFADITSVLENWDGACP